MTMTDTAAQTPLAIDRVERTRGKKDQVRLRLSGRWIMPGDAGADALLVVQLHGRRHRFPAGDGGDEGPGAGEPGRPFSASFTIPDWAVPEQPGQAVLWVGDAVVPVPAPGASPSAVNPDSPARGPASTDPPGAAYPDPAVGEASAEPAPESLGASAGRSGPLSQLLFKETVDALHSELEQRSAETARLRSALAQLRADLEGRSTTQSGLQAAHVELRDELARLMDAASGQREEFEGRLAATVAERDQAREELGRSGEELGGARTQLSSVRDELARLEEELTASRAALTRAGQESEDRLVTARSEFDQQLAAVRAESEAALVAARAQAENDVSSARQRADAELAAARAESEAMLAAARGHSDGRVLAAEAQTRELSDRVAMLQAADRRRGEDLSALREQLAASHIARDAALGEADGLRGELDRVGSELGALREQAGPPGGDLSEARQLLADARALTERLRGGSEV